MSRSQVVLDCRVQHTSTILHCPLFQQFLFFLLFCCIWKVTVVEFGKVLRCMGHDHEDDDIQDWFDLIDTDRGGEIGFVEFADMWCGPHSEVQQLVKERCGELRALFNLFDEDGGGLLDLGELSYIMKQLGRKPSDEELAELIHRNLEEAHMLALTLPLTLASL